MRRNDGVRAGLPVWRVALVGLPAVGLAWLAFTAAAANVSRTSDPQRALKFRPGDSLALGMLAQSHMVGTAVPARRPDARMAEIARRAIEGLAINTPAIQALAVQESLSGNEAKARRLFGLSDRLSRRDLATQLWLIEDAVRRNDVPGALRHYDSALRTKMESRQLLLPILASAAEDRELWPALAPFVNAENPWLNAFIRQALSSTKRPDLLAGMLMHAGGLPETDDLRPLTEELLRGLVEGRYFEVARRYYLTLPGARARVLHDAQLTEVTTSARFAPITWQPSALEDIRGSILGGGPGGSLVLSTAFSSGAQGFVARKLLALAPGNYVVRARQAIREESQNAELRWSMRCADTAGRILWSANVPLTTGPQLVRGSFNVPDGCAYQFMSINGDAGTSPFGGDVSIDSIGVRRTD